MHLTGFYRQCDNGLRGQKLKSCISFYLMMMMLVLLIFTKHACVIFH